MCMPMDSSEIVWSKAPDLPGRNHSYDFLKVCPEDVTSSRSCSSRTPSTSSRGSAQKPRWADMSDSEDDSAKDSPRILAPIAPLVRVFTPEQAQLKVAAVQQSLKKPSEEGRKVAAAHQFPEKSTSHSKRKSGGRRQQGRNPDSKSQCQFVIGIEEEAKFRVARRILGSAGANVKAIAEQTGAKLRLRGRGSKFLEGPEQEESRDPLMLCLSVPNRSGYETARQIVWELLERVYAEYDDFLVKHHQKPLHLSPQMHEGPREGSR